VSAISTLFDDLRSISPKVEPLIAVVEVALSVTGLGGAAAVEAVTILESALKAFEAGASGTLTADQVLAEMAKIKSTAIEAAQDAALVGRFPAPSGAV